MAVIEMQKEPRSIRAMLFVAAMIVGFLALCAVIFWLLKPNAPRQVKLSGEQAKQAIATAPPAPTPALPPQPPVPQAQDPGPTLVTLDLKQVTPRQAIEAMAKQAKVDLQGGGRQQQQQGFFASLMAARVDASYANEPFWAAMFDVCRKGNLAPYVDHQQPDHISFRPGSPPAGPMVNVGSCAIVLGTVTSRFDANLTGPRPPRRSLTVGMTLFVEPKLNPYRIASIVTVETAVDEKGNNLIRPRGQSDDRGGGGGRTGNWTREVTAHLLFPDNAGQRIAKLKGYASVAVAGPEKSETIDNPLAARNVDRTIDGTLVRLVQLQKQGSNAYYARMAGDANSPVFRDYERFSKVVALIDANGKEFERSGGGWGGSRANTFEFMVHFRGEPGMGEPKVMRVSLPTGVKEVRVPFEFADLPLPH